MIKVYSEFGNLKKIVLHRPGEETENMTPSMFSSLLFDDFYYLKEAQKEHDLFAKALKENGVEVIYLKDLVIESFEVMSTESRNETIHKFIVEAGVFKDSSLFDKVFKFLSSFKKNSDLVTKMMIGIEVKEITGIKSKKPLTLLERATHRHFILDPLPNLIFTRDCWSSIGSGVSIHTMSRTTRKRESIFGEIIFTYHPDFNKTTRYYERDRSTSLEGGDIMIFSEKEIAVGISERTHPDSIEKLARNIFSDPNSKIEKIYAIDIPKGRSWMHLDTVFTQIDQNKFVVFTNYEFKVFILEKTKLGEYKINETKADLEKILKQISKKPIEVFKTGGGDPFLAEREQWNDGSNVLAIGPSKVIAYDRNYVTNAVLKKAGIKVIEVSGSELSRGRGGPRCMSMPIERDLIKK